jgi:hypothetical protein
MSSPADRLISDAYADRMGAEAERALSRPDTHSVEEQYFVQAVCALVRDRQARMELAVIRGN